MKHAITLKLIFTILLSIEFQVKVESLHVNCKYLQLLKVVAGAVSLHPAAQATRI